MIRVVIVEDNETEAQVLSAYIEAWRGDHGEETIGCTVYADPVRFLEQGSAAADIVFMDIEMPYMNGMDAAAEFRKRNQEAILIFATWATKYAVRGYAVDAIGYLVKPIRERAFREVFEKALRLYRKRERGQTVMLKTRAGVANVRTDQIQYIEADAHLLHVYAENAVYDVWSAVDKMLESLPEDFVRCHKGYIVNLKHVYTVGKDGLRIMGRSDVTVPISRTKRAEFMDRLMRYYTSSMGR